jgi:Putative abortive phage resistance protein AbiGi, antitoxin
MSENISANVLFHFTKSLENIVDILKSGFYPHYCPEYLFGRLQAKAASAGMPPAQAAPMVCFCDLPLSLIRRHLDGYGHFGIGLAKRWGIKNGVSPVFYTHEQSQTFKPLSNRNWVAWREKDTTAMNELRLLSAYMKPIRGTAWRDGKTQQNVHFYDEREWRYVPHLPVGEHLFLSRDEYTDKTKVETLHASFKQKYNLPICPDDIQYLIVPDDGFILKLVKHLGTLYGPDDAIIVTTAIMTTDCITDDA